MGLANFLTLRPLQLLRPDQNSEDFRDGDGGGDVHADGDGDVDVVGDGDGSVD